MREHFEYVALHDIKVPDAYAVAARAGDEMTAAQVDGLRERGLDLVVGVDVNPLGPQVIERPDDEAPVREWRAYAVGMGMDAETADESSKEEIMTQYPQPEPAQPTSTPTAQPAVTPDAGTRPAKSATKGEWVDYVESTGQLDRAAAEAMTKEDLVSRYGG